LPDGSAAYTRDGQFKLDTAGKIVTNTGANVMGYPTDTSGTPISSTTQALSLPTTAPIAAKETDTIVAEFNLDARAKVAATAPVTPRTTYGTSLNAYDSQGLAWPVNLYFVKVPSTTTDNWNVYTNADPLVQADAAPTFTMSFGADGSLTSPTTMPTIVVPTTTGVTGDISATLDISDVTQYGANFAVSNLTQNGYAPGELVSLKIGEKGVITARYSNGQTQAAGQVALANFRNVQGLAPSGGGNWRETANSGQPVLGAPGQGKLGVLNAGAVEESNVDLTAELVNMMTAQRAYQANAQTIKTQDQVMSTLVNLR
jgi:flagellar hook protein FlgE